MKNVYPVFFTKTDSNILVEVPDFNILTEGKDFSDAFDFKNKKDRYACTWLSGS